MYGEFLIKILSVAMFTMLFVAVGGWMYETAKKARAEGNHLVVPLQVFITLVVASFFVFLVLGHSQGISG